MGPVAALGRALAAVEVSVDECKSHHGIGSHGPGLVIGDLRPSAGGPRGSHRATPNSDQLSKNKGHSPYFDSREDYLSARAPRTPRTPRTATDSHGQPRTATDSHGQPRTATNSHGQPQIATVHHRHPITQGLHCTLGYTCTLPRGPPAEGRRSPCSQRHPPHTPSFALAWELGSALPRNV